LSCSCPHDFGTFGLGPVDPGVWRFTEIPTGKGLPPGWARAVSRVRRTHAGQRD